MSNNKQSSIDWLIEQIQNNIHHTIRIPLDTIEQSKAMHNEEKLTNYSDGYLEGFNRALDLVELTVEEYKNDIYYYQGLAKIYSRIKELRG